MATLYSNELKALLVTGDFIENTASVLKDHCLTVQSFSYDCIHKRNDSGELYGPSQPVILQFSVRVNSAQHSKPFYQALYTSEHLRYSFIFNATFGANQRLADYEDGMVADAYVLRIEENYASSAPQDGVDRQIMLDVTLQVCSITYLGSTNNFTCTFIK